jgi:hypothetical protein
MGATCITFKEPTFGVINFGKSRSIEGYFNPGICLIHVLPYRVFSPWRCPTETG